MRKHEDFIHFNPLVYFTLTHYSFNIALSAVLSQIFKIK